MKKYTPEQKLLLEQIDRIAEGLGQTLAPFCEVVVHDLLDKKNAIRVIHNNLSGRKPGDPATVLGLARIADPDYPQILANYPNKFADGRQVKSTSIGIKDSTGNFIAALCLNIDLSIFQGFRNVLDQFVTLSADGNLMPKESLDPASGERIRTIIDAFAARHSTTPRALKVGERKTLIQELKDSGCLELRKSIDMIADHLGISRASVYNYLK